MYFETTTNSIEYTADVVSSQGVKIILYTRPDHNHQMIELAKQEIRRRLDVVCIWIASEEDWNERYRTEVFRHPQVRPLCWYEINDEPNLIGQHRRAGTPVEQYVKQFVLPMVAQTRAANIEKYGERVINS